MSIIYNFRPNKKILGCWRIEGKLHFNIFVEYIIGLYPMNRPWRKKVRSNILRTVANYFKQIKYTVVSILVGTEKFALKLEIVNL